MFENKQICQKQTKNKTFLGMLLDYFYMLVHTYLPLFWCFSPPPKTNVFIAVQHNQKKVKDVLQTAMLLGENMLIEPNRSK